MPDTNTQARLTLSRTTVDNNAILTAMRDRNGNWEFQFNSQCFETVDATEFVRLLVAMAKIDRNV